MFTLTGSVAWVVSKVSCGSLLGQTVESIRPELVEAPIVTSWKAFGPGWKEQPLQMIESGAVVELPA